MLKRIRFGVIIVQMGLLLGGCGRVESNQPVQSGQINANDSTATTQMQTALVVAGTEEAERYAYEQAWLNETATALVDPRPTAGPSTFPTLEPSTPHPTLEYRLLTHEECDPSGGEPRGSAFVTNCWHGLVGTQDLLVGARGVRAEVGTVRIGFLRVFEGFEFVDYHYPTEQGALTIVDVQLPNLVISVGGSFNVLFNLETRQWLDLNGTPIATPTTTLTP